MLLLFGNVKALDFHDIRMHRAVEGLRGAVVRVHVQVAHPHNLGANLDDNFFKRRGLPAKLN